jgi:hypothetical protein
VVAERLDLHVAELMQDLMRGVGPEGFIYVWGQVCYDDGFGRRRFTKYCHRYNRRVLRRLDDGGYGIPERDARFHEYGNDAN